MNSRLYFAKANIALKDAKKLKANKQNKKKPFF
jgi:hypothetical protein